MLKFKDYSVNFVEPDDSTIHNILFSFYSVKNDTLLHDKVAIFFLGFQAATNFEDSDHNVNTWVLKVILSIDDKDEMLVAFVTSSTWECVLNVSISLLFLAS